MMRSFGIWHQQLVYRKILNLTFREIKLASVGVPINNLHILKIHIYLVEYTYMLYVTKIYSYSFMLQKVSHTAHESTKVNLSAGETAHVA